MRVRVRVRVRESLRESVSHLLCSAFVCESIHADVHVCGGVCDARVGGQRTYPCYERLQFCREEILDAEDDLADAQQELAVATADTVFFDTSFIHGSMQRYRLDDIYPKLHNLSFQKIVEIIVTRAEVCATERQLRDVSAFLQENGRKIVRKERDLRQLQRNTLRREWMTTKRSFLADYGFFPRARRAALAAAFGGWVTLMSFKANIHKAFDLRYALLKQEQEIKLFQEVRSRVCM